MHMADALLSPAVGATMWVATAATIGYCAKRVRVEDSDRRIPLMGVVGAFVFAAQMINFTIPGTGSSGHLGGGLLLAILLGPHAAFLTMASILAVQALFFADGGLLALGANIFNLGFVPCFLAYPLFYRPLAGSDPSPGRILLGSLVAAILGLQAGAFGVVLETVSSGVSELPFAAFALLMQPIHLAIGIVEGLVTSAVVSFVWKAEPGILAQSEGRKSVRRQAFRKVILSLGIAALIAGVALSWFASAHPDGLEWAISRVTGADEWEAPDKELHSTLGRLQETVSVLPDYGFRPAGPEGNRDEAEVWPAVDAGTSVSGVVGGILTLAVACAVGWVLRRKTRTA